jgi:hypothetical protein
LTRPQILLSRSATPTSALLIGALLLAAACRSASTGKDSGAPEGELAEDGDGDGVPASEDCDDADASISPGATEICDGVDNDCDGAVDEAVTGTWYVDADEDGFGDEAVPVEACEAPPGSVSNHTDCDDEDELVYPGAFDFCDEKDNDCDEEIDEDEPLTWYADADADGWGDADARVLSCSQPEGYTADDGDCDDTSDAAFPGHAELCDEIDNNCDGDVDEGVRQTFYEDRDTDGYGRLDATTEACVSPEGYAALSGDCDDDDPAYNPGAAEADCADPNDYNCDGSVGYADADADGWAACVECDDADEAVHPAATEVCDGKDDDCDGLSDDLDPSLDLATALSWYADTDSDTYGDPSALTVSCLAPAGAVADDRDCDDAQASVNPAGVELCNEQDDDCDTLIDEGVGTTFWLDADADSYGDAAAPTVECTLPTGHSTNDDDCDDSDPLVYPGAPERADGEDDDCDGTIDDHTWIGTGVDGALSVTGVTVLSDAWPVLALGADTVTLASSPGLSVGDEVLLINMHGSDAAHSHVGVYEFAFVGAVSGDTVTLDAPLSGIYGEATNSDLSGQALQLVRVGQYTDVTVAATGLLTAEAWDGSTGGVLALRATGTVSVLTGGAISVDELGYAGGATGTCSGCDAFQGESYAGSGDGNLPSIAGYYGNYAAGYYLNNYGGGGAMITGAGGEHGGGATDGGSWYPGIYPAPESGQPYGTASLSTLFFGSGGAGVWNGSSSPGSGGDGAGIVYVAAQDVVLAGSAALSAIGGTTTAWATGSWTYGAGGGAGGSVWLIGDTLTLSTGSVEASGGFGESTHIRVGGDGGVGRVRVQYSSLNGAAYGTTADTVEQQAACTPDAGSVAAP